jgi:hypothetical protein
MAKARVVFVVGHRHWGKSKTLSALAGMRRYISLDSVEFFIRRMSNDDKPSKFYKKMREVKPAYVPHLIVAFCPTLRHDSKARQCLAGLRHRGYGLSFWVMRQQQKPGTTGTITPEEIKSLKKYGRVKVFKGLAEKSARAKALRRFIREVVD